ncbi:MAG: hypothetical protein COZ03_05510 [Candidatus Aquicultor secundus]|nr:MAG: hypothetical protein COT10_10800 [Candidatus Aquicultor secundus]PIX51252.1 MAG: hypothetical protein COZ51_10655 [Candidatus Aquicultor secundus]PIY39725.1 MAG: hypothetical protein COZ03_05510 [Candidatus Aquicultor secundus]
MGYVYTIRPRVRDLSHLNIPKLLAHMRIHKNHRMAFADKLRIHHVKLVPSNDFYIGHPQNAL